MEYETLRHGTVHAVRQSIRAGRYTSHTAGLGQGFLQANLVILPQAFAFDFMRFCQRNPKPCPLIAVSEPGDPNLFTAGRDLDIRTDVPGYNVYRDGQVVGSADSVVDLWRNDLVTFALGCSFTFEHALIEAGIDLWHVTNNTTVPMFRTNLDTVPAGAFQGPMVMTMRMIPDDKIEVARSISSRFPLAHGAPMHWGKPSDIGIVSLENPDWGDPAPIEAGKTAMFWACGVTPQVAIAKAGVPFCITHKPGHMLITDIPDTAEVPILQ